MAVAGTKTHKTAQIAILFMVSRLEEVNQTSDTQQQGWCSVTASFIWKARHESTEMELHDMMVSSIQPSANMV